MEETRVFCTYCDSPVPAVRTCLQCEASFCEKHLQSHSKSSEHRLFEPTLYLDKMKCSIHKEELKYYCPMDSTCICVSCWVAGDHKAHDVEPLDVASKRKKEMLRSVVEKMNSDKTEAGRRIQDLIDHGIEEAQKSVGVSERVTNLFSDLRKKLDDLEKRIQGEISRQKDQVSLSVSDMIRKLELHKDELTKKIHQFEGSCDITDPLTFLQDNLITGEISFQCCDVINGIRKAQSLDGILVSQTLHRGLLRFVDDLNNIRRNQFPVMKKSEVLLDIDSAQNHIIISRNLRSASHTSISQKRPDGPKRLWSSQVFSSCSFSSGRHYWEVDVTQAEEWIIGVVGESLDRKGMESYIGYNERSWGLRTSPKFGSCHNCLIWSLKSDSPVKIVGIYLDYEAGRLSFYQLCDPIRHLYTFTASFTEPLYAAFCLYDSATIRVIK
ncbi:E3 ubiquitin-protein ligase TRIM7-like [Engystomops pustulosus]|uniref:E3 ubiquitin-protein ligase TRIM7-like n=1 Tax=Engystomops pustulosus TaxID=76066 RepID=UPI003AFA5CA3